MNDNAPWDKCAQKRSKVVKWVQKQHETMLETNQMHSNGQFRLQINEFLRVSSWRGEPYALKGARTVRGGEARKRFLLHFR